MSEVNTTEAKARAPQGPVREAFREGRELTTAAFIFGAGVNLLYLAPSIYMLQVYDRVLLTGGLVTLGFISLVLAGALLTLVFLDAMRTRLLTRLSLRLDRLLSPALLALALRRDQREPGERTSYLRDFDTFRQTISGSAATAVMDAPWAPIFVIVCAIIHPLLGLAVLFGGAVLVVLALIADRSQRQLIAEASDATPRAYAAQEADAASAPTVRALGMRSALIHRQIDARSRVNTLQTRSQFNAIRYSSSTKFVRLFLQSAVLGLGAWLAIDQQISPGAMIAASILSSRALTPLDQIVAAWRQIGQARATYATLEKALADSSPRETHTALPAPRGLLRFERASLRLGATDRFVLTELNFECKPGEILGVIGPSGAGKSTLARVAVGAVSPTLGTVRLDNANLADWDPDTLGRHIGYLPQEIHLLSGTISENIRRFSERTPDNAEALDAATVAAAQAAGAHDMIVRLPMGYDTQLGLGGAGLSLGQSQRIGLARALFGDPALIVLDEPNAHLDQEGEAALVETLKAARARGAAVLIVAHRAGVLALADRLLVLVEGRVQSIGPREEIVRRQAGAAGLPSLPPREAHS